MQSLKPFLFILAGMTIAFLVSFKLDAPKKEYCKVSWSYGKGPIVYIDYPDRMNLYNLIKTQE